jgi:DNA-binding transcriptional LysR family regulator
MPWDDKISRRLKLKDLQTLMAVIEAGGIGKAADRLNHSQPAISKPIASLERTLGKRLFERGRKGIELTPYGDAMLKCGTAVFDDLRKGVEEVDFLADPAAGEIRIACTEPVFVGIVSAIISRFVRQYPRVVFDVVLRDAFAIYRDLDTRTVDLVIAQASAPIDTMHMQQEILYHERVVVVAGAHHPFARKRRLTLAELVNEAWVLPPRRSFITSLVIEAFRAIGLSAPRIAVFMQGSRLMLVASNQLLTVVPTVMLKAGAKYLSIKALPIELPSNRRPVSLVTLKNRALSPVAQLFIEHARAVANAIAKD